VTCTADPGQKWKTTGADIAEPNWELNFIVEHSGDVHGSTKQGTAFQKRYFSGTVTPDGVVDVVRGLVTCSLEIDRTAACKVRRRTQESILGSYYSTGKRGKDLLRTGEAAEGRRCWQGGHLLGAGEGQSSG